jgi:hypothetical protein
MGYKKTSDLPTAYPHTPAIMSTTESWVWLSGDTLMMHVENDGARVLRRGLDRRDFPVTLEELRSYPQLHSDACRLLEVTRDARLALAAARYSPQPADFDSPAAIYGKVRAYAGASVRLLLKASFVTRPSFRNCSNSVSMKYNGQPSYPK